MRVIGAWKSSSPAQSRTFSICLFRRCHLGEVSPIILSQTPTPNSNPVSLRVSPDRDYVLPRSLDGVGHRAPSHLDVVAAYLTVWSPPRVPMPPPCLSFVPSAYYTPQACPSRNSFAPAAPRPPRLLQHLLPTFSHAPLLMLSRPPTLMTHSSPTIPLSHASSCAAYPIPPGTSRHLSRHRSLTSRTWRSLMICLSSSPTNSSPVPTLRVKSLCCK